MPVHCTASAPTWIRSSTRRRARGMSGRSRTRRRRSAPPQGDRQAGAIGTSAASRSSRARTSAPSATPGCVTTNDAALAQRAPAAAQSRRASRSTSIARRRQLPPRCAAGGGAAREAAAPARLDGGAPRANAARYGSSSAKRRQYPAVAAGAARHRSRRVVSSRCRSRSRRRHIFNQYIVRAGDRDGLKRPFAAAGIGTEIYYPVPFHLQTCFASWATNPAHSRWLKHAAADSLALPIYGGAHGTAAAAVVESIVRFYC